MVMPTQHPPHHTPGLCFPTTCPPPAYRLPPTTPQVSDLFTLVDSVATVDIQNLLLINLCANYLMPDPVKLPAAGVCQTQAIYPITYSRCVFSACAKYSACS